VEGVHLTVSLGTRLSNMKSAILVSSDFLSYICCFFAYRLLLSRRRKLVKVFMTVVMCYKTHGKTKLASKIVI